MKELFKNIRERFSGSDEEVLGEFLKTSDRDDFVISTKFTPQLAEMFEGNEVTATFSGIVRVQPDTPIA